MIDPRTVAALVLTFSDTSDGAAQKSRELILLLLEQSSEPFSRHTCTPGHITCSGLVLAPDNERLLLVHHRRLDRWLLPGGHVEPSDAAIVDTARREVIEETGAILAPEPLFPAPASLDVHGIPAHRKRQEPYHLHHDLTFAFQALSDEFQISEESRDAAWCAPAEFERYDLPGNIRRAYARAIGARVRKLSSSQ